MSNSSTLYTYNLEDFTAWDAANILEFATSRFAAIWLACDRSYVPQSLAYKSNFIRHLLWEADNFVFPYINTCMVLNILPTKPDLLRNVIARFVRFQTGHITTEEMHNEFLMYCSPNDPELRSIHRVIPNYRHDWWKDYFDTLGLEMPALNVREVMEMAQDHFEQLVGHFSLSCWTSIHANCQPMGAMLAPSPAVTGQVDGDALFNQIVAVRAHLQHLGEAMASLLEQKTQIAAEATSTMS
ncbi:hypothetical protein F4604DRAFT_1686628 [Suillus subluteus]|nr:hypothetical protein F4604DRAFT_1686628 [Suillus subluteus]